MKLLPYPDIPMLISYHNKAFPFGIIEANSPEDITKWACTKCINCVYDPNSPQNKFDFALIDPWGNSERIMTHQCFFIKKDLMALVNIDLISMLKIFIDNGCYVQGEYNEKYIPVKKAYGKYDFNHDFLLIGYDDEYFYSVGFVSDSRFERFKIPIRNFVCSIYDSNSSRVRINFFSYNKGSIPKPDIGRMLSDLDKYISTVNYLNHPTPRDMSYGISTLIRIKEFFIDEVVNNQKLYVDKRYSRVLYEHEWIFTQVIDCFLDDKEKIVYINHACENLNRARLVHMLGLKLEYTQDAGLIYRIAEYIDEIFEDEKQYIPNLIALLKEKHEKNII